MTELREKQRGTLGNDTGADNAADETDKLVPSPPKPKKAVASPVFYFLTESVLVVGGIPSILFFITGIINGLLIIIEYDEYKN